MLRLIIHIAASQILYYNHPFSIPNLAYTSKSLSESIPRTLKFEEHSHRNNKKVAMVNKNFFTNKSWASILGKQCHHADTLELIKLLTCHQAKVRLRIYCSIKLDDMLVTEHAQNTGLKHTSIINLSAHINILKMTAYVTERKILKVQYLDYP